MLDEFDREAAREGFALTVLKTYNNTRKGDGKSSPHTGRVKLPKNVDVDVVRILKIIKDPNGLD
jgi:hypothetical protein